MSVKKNIYFLVVLLAFSCNSNDMHKGRIPIVKVGESFLYKEDIITVLPEEYTSEDSTIKVNSFIDIWVKKQLMVQIAEKYLSDEQDDIDAKIEDYKNSLLIHKYKQKFIEQKLDTNITTEEIEEYYLLHSTDFKLTKPVIKGTFVKLLKTDDNSSSVKFWCLSSSPKDSLKLLEYCLENATTYQDFEGEWVYLSNIITDNPIIINNEAEFLQRRDFIDAEDETFYYFLKIKEYKLINEISPLVFVTDNIKTILLNKREKLMIEELETTIYQNALNDGNLEYFNK
jgi:hypothetical protein